MPRSAESARDLGAAREGVQDGRWCRCCEEALQQCSVGSYAVQQQWQARFSRGGEVDVEHRELANACDVAPARAEVESALADRHQTRICPEKGCLKSFSEVFVVLREKIAEDVGVHPKGSVKAHVWYNGTQRVRRRRDPGPRTRFDARDQDRGDSCDLSPQASGSLFFGGIEGGQVQVRVSVKKSHARRRLASLTQLEPFCTTHAALAAFTATNDEWGPSTPETRSAQKR